MFSIRIFNALTCNYTLCYMQRFSWLNICTRAAFVSVMATVHTTTVMHTRGEGWRNFTQPLKHFAQQRSQTQNKTQFSQHIKERQQQDTITKPTWTVTLHEEIRVKIFSYLCVDKEGTMRWECGWSRITTFPCRATCTSEIDRCVYVYGREREMYRQPYIHYSNIHNCCLCSIYWTFSCTRILKYT